MEETNKNDIKPNISIIKSTLKTFMIIGLVIALSTIFLTFSLREVCMNDSSDSSLKDYKKEFKQLET